MFSTIKLKNNECYLDEQVLGPLKQINFIYGENGCGKSTIAKFLNCKSSEENANNFLECSFENTNRNNEYRLLVYDADFVIKTISQPTIDGIFVLGEDAPNQEKQRLDHEKKIREKTTQREEKDKSIDDCKKTIKEEEDKLTAECWKIKQKYDEYFSSIYTGYNRSREKFREKCIGSIPKNERIRTLEELREQIQIYFNSQGKPAPLRAPEKLRYADLTTLRPLPLLGTAIKGKEETTIAEAIERLGNADWVAQGRDFFDGHKCPFCHQNTPHTLKDDLESYFDVTYQKSKDALSDYTERYTNEMDRLIDIIKNLSEIECRFLDTEKIKTSMVNIQTKITSNKINLRHKKREPSKVIRLESISEHLESINNTIERAQQEVARFNESIKHFDNGKENLTKDIWSFLGNEASTYYNIFIKIKKSKEKEIESIISAKKKLDSEIELHEIAAKEARKKLKNSDQPVEDINKILLSFGFSNFSLRKEKEKAHYSIVRKDGRKANNTLSEGEKNFISFLYFYHMAIGLSSDQNEPENKIIIFDDPVSSLDNKVLYIVGTLIKSLAREQDRHKIRQLFVLTHNLYFFKEVTIQQTPEKRKSTYWTIRKTNSGSRLENHKEIPIRTSYQMLWDDVIQAQKNNNIDVRNTLRRIIENYFEVFGGISKWNLAKNFEGNDKEICNSLLHWTNDGSHVVFDDIFVSQSSADRDNYLRVFKDIFFKNNHGDHYRMMMKEEEAIPPEETYPPTR